ncbi:MAG: hypothetical protein JST68_11310 [Bacteroidetes bacterium]|nr:hypothetical protein [Bacteroidota bacterium]
MLRIIALLLLPTAIFAQDTTTHFSVAATYNTGLNYYGRVDSLHSKGFYPSVGLTLKNGLYATSTFVFIQNSLTNQYAATLVEGGYNFNNKKNTWAGSLSVSKFFYQADVSLVQSAIKEMASFSLTHLNKIINVTASANVKFSGYTDIGVQAGLDHIIKFTNVLGQGVIVLDPSANVFAGTQNFTKTEYQKKNILLFPVAEQEITTNSKRFNLLSYEFSFPIIYGYKKLNLILNPAYVLPQNLINLPSQQELGAPLFYLTATAKVTL